MELEKITLHFCIPDFHKPHNVQIPNDAMLLMTTGKPSLNDPWITSSSLPQKTQQNLIYSTMVLSEVSKRMPVSHLPECGVPEKT